MATGAMNKQLRHGQILRVIAAQALHTQDDLARELRRRGIRVTQVTLSRDLHELNIVKTPQGYRLPGSEVPPRQALDQQLRRAAADFLREVRQAQNLLVLKTTVGGAQPVALALDKENWPEIAGTIAGDDTILVVTADVKTAVVVRERLLAFVK
jgi:transcriptional regulator of arginine metabolism